VIFPAARHEVPFWHGRERVPAALVLPRTPGPHPLVLVGGAAGQAGDSGVDPVGEWSGALLAAGLAVCSWRRPGGADAGLDPSRRADDHAREVLAAAARASLVPGVDARRVAVVGWGVGGPGAVRAAAFGATVGAVLVVGAPVAEARVLATLSAVSAPLLLLIGELDDRAPAADAARAARRVLVAAGHPDHEVAVVRGADRDLRVRASHGLGGLVDGRFRFGDLPRGLARLLAEWIADRLRGTDEVPSFPPPDVPEPAWAPAPSDLVVDLRDPGPRVGPPVPVRQSRRRLSD